MSLKATKGFALLKPDWEHGQHDGRIIVPETADQKLKCRVPQTGTVVSMSGAPVTKNGVSYDPEFRPGDKVFCKEYAGEFVEHEGQKLVRVPLHAVLVVLEETGGIKPER